MELPLSPATSGLPTLPAGAADCDSDRPQPTKSADDSGADEAPPTVRAGAPKQEIGADAMHPSDAARSPRVHFHHAGAERSDGGERDPAAGADVAGGDVAVDPSTQQQENPPDAMPPPAPRPHAQASSESFLHGIEVRENARVVSSFASSSRDRCTRRELARRAPYLRIQKGKNDHFLIGCAQVSKRVLAATTVSQLLASTID